MKLIFDCEMTGLKPEEDELLQLSIVNEEGEVLFDEYFKPEYVFEWPRAQRLTGISPEMVEDCPGFSERKKTIQAIFDEASELIGYNTPSDLVFLRNAGIKIPDVKITDVMVDFAPIYAEAYHKSVKNKKLTVCAKYYGYEYEAHNSLNDALATLHCYKKIHNNTFLASHRQENGIWCF